MLRFQMIGSHQNIGVSNIISSKKKTAILQCTEAFHFLYHDSMDKSATACDVPWFQQIVYIFSVSNWLCLFLNYLYK